MLARRYYGLPSHSCGPTVWALHMSHQSEASSAVPGNFTDCGLFHLAVILSRSLPQKCTLYVSKAHSDLSSLFKAFFHLTQHFQQLESRPAAASDLWCLSEYLESESSSFLLPGALSSGENGASSSLSQGSFCWGGLRVLGKQLSLPHSRLRFEDVARKTRSLLEGWDGQTKRNKAFNHHDESLSALTKPPGKKVKERNAAE